MVQIVRMKPPPIPGGGFLIGQIGVWTAVIVHAKLATVIKSITVISPRCEAKKEDSASK
jgi:hypothetical protein